MTHTSTSSKLKESSLRGAYADGNKPLASLTDQPDSIKKISPQESSANIAAVKGLARELAMAQRKGGKTSMRSYAPYKRLIDIVLSILIGVVALPIFIVLAIWVAIDSPGPIIFRQKRMTRGVQPFYALKFRTMRVAQDAGANDGITSTAKQSRITKSGRIMRKYRMDELPQLWNVIKGEMSLVGPRPQTPRYVEIYPDIYEQILSIRPGITGLASIKFHEKEEEMIADAGDKADDIYINKILPMKFRYNLFYVRHSSLLFDLKIIWWTVLGMVGKAKG